MSGVFGLAAAWLEGGRPEEPTCRYHGTLCGMGATWPVERPPVPDELLDLIAECRHAAGLPVVPHPRDLWLINEHVRVPPAEVAAERAEIDRLIAEQKAVNAAVEAELAANNEPSASGA